VRQDPGQRPAIPLLLASRLFIGSPRYELISRGSADPQRAAVVAQSEIEVVLAAHNQQHPDAFQLRLDRGGGGGGIAESKGESKAKPAAGMDSAWAAVESKATAPRRLTIDLAAAVTALARLDDLRIPLKVGLPAEVTAARLGCLDGAFVAQVEFTGEVGVDQGGLTQVFYTGFFEVCSCVTAPHAVSILTTYIGRLSW
jgi:hypothetical protein